MFFRNPFEWFDLWFQTQLKRPNVHEPTAMCLSTCTSLGLPSARMVLLKHVSESGGFVFFTNYESRKAKQMAENNRVALTFYWDTRQVRVEGEAEKIPADESDEYFKSRPRGSKIGAWASKQSRAMKDRADFEREIKEVEEKFKDSEDVKRPYNWGGYRVIPNLIEFWEAQPSRLHQRHQFTKEGDQWKLEILYP